MATTNVLSCDRVLLVKLAPVLGRNAQLLARVEEALGQLGVVGGVVAVEEGLVAALDHEAGDVHGHRWLARSSRGGEAILVGPWRSARDDDVASRSGAGGDMAGHMCGSAKLTKIEDVDGVLGKHPELLVVLWGPGLPGLPG